MVDENERYRSPDYGGRSGYAILHWWIRRLGVWPAYLLCTLIVPYYIVFRPSARRAVGPYLRHRHRGRSAGWRLIETVRHYFAFAQVLIDQAAMGLLGRSRDSVSFDGANALRELVHEGRGVVLVTSHVGNWQTSMAEMSDLGVPVHFQLQLDEHTHGRHFFELAGEQDRFRIVSPRGFLGGMVELTNALQAGECVAVMGDRAWGGKTREISFLDEPAPFPVSPFHLAVRTGADLVVLLTARTGRRASRVEHTVLTGDAALAAMPREQAVAGLMRRYVACLEDYVARHPRMWFNFFDFWSGRQDNGA